MRLKNTNRWLLVKGSQRNCPGEVVGEETFYFADILMHNHPTHSNPMISINDVSLLYYQPIPFGWVIGKKYYQQYCVKGHDYPFATRSFEPFSLRRYFDGLYLDQYKYCDPLRNAEGDLTPEAWYELEAFMHNRKIGTTNIPYAEMDLSRLLDGGQSLIEALQSPRLSESIIALNSLAHFISP